jgi:hypothetical protein
LAARDQVRRPPDRRSLDGGGGLRLITRNGYDWTPVFRMPFRDLLSCPREIVLDGEIAVPNDRGVTTWATFKTVAGRRADRLAYFASRKVEDGEHRKCRDREQRGDPEPAAPSLATRGSFRIGSRAALSPPPGHWFACLGFFRLTWYLAVSKVLPVLPICWRKL